MPRKLTTDVFIEKSKKIHGDKYDYSLVNYINQKNRVKIICPIHGIFEQLPTDHYFSGAGCPYCANNVVYTTDVFIEKSKKIHGDKYDYSLVNYINNKTKIKIICPIHGIFEQRPDEHLKGSMCRFCANNVKFDTKIFIEKSVDKHGVKYDYSLVNYINSHIKVKIICPIHGEFEQKPYHHLNGVGCPYCRESKGEKEVEKYLKINNIKYIRQYTFDNCRDKRKLPFDFYLPDFNICVEFDGALHFISVQYFGGFDKLVDTQKKDKIKTDYCKNNNIKLLRIKYDENISDKMITLKLITKILDKELD